MKGTHSALYSFILLCLFTLVGSLCLTVLAADPPKPEWRTNDCHNGFSHCANVTTKESWSKDGKDIYFFLDAVVSIKDGKWSNTTVWYVGENFDISWAEDLQEATFNVVRFSPRGSEFAYPQITCNVNYYNTKNDCQPNASCMKEIAQSGLDMAHYSIDETARDLAWVLNTLGAGMKNVVVSEGLGNFVVERMLKNVGHLHNISVIMAGYTHPEYFDLFQSFGGYDGALQQLLYFCEKDPTFQCAFRTGAFEGLWNRFVNVMVAAELGTLKCNSQLDWGVKPEEMHLEYRSILAALLKTPQHFLLPSQIELAQLIPSFIYRLQRCGERDKLALTHLYHYIKSGTGVQCPLFIPQRYNWLVNELTLSKPPATPEDLLSEITSERLVVPNITVLRNLYSAYESYPKYEVASRLIAKTNVNLLLLPSDVDPVFSLGMAAAASAVYSSNVRFLPHQTSFPVTSTASDCIKTNLAHFHRFNTWADPSTCALPSRYNLNFIGLDARNYYGVVDAWEFTVPNKPELFPNSSFTTPAPVPPADKKCSHRLTTLFVVFFVLTLLTLIGVSYMYWRKTKERGFSDDFYSNLNH